MLCNVSYILKHNLKFSVSHRLLWMRGMENFYSCIMHRLFITSRIQVRTIICFLKETQSRNDKDQTTTNTKGKFNILRLQILFNPFSYLHVRDKAPLFNPGELTVN